MRIYEIIVFIISGYVQDSFYKELETEYKKTIESIEKYGGFYIGRYETGNLSSNTPVVRRMNTNIDCQNWYIMYAKMQNISTNSNIQTNMILGSLWDETLAWILKTGDKTNIEIGVDSTNWGNFYKGQFKYYNNAGTLAFTKYDNYSTKLPTGSSERNKANNIYDLAGNVIDFTLENFQSNTRAFRGGVYSRTGQPSIAGARSPSSVTGIVSIAGYRAYFYIK